MAFQPKMAELQAFKVVPDLLVHAVYTNFLPVFGITKIWRFLIWRFLEIFAIREILALFWKFGDF